MRVLITGSAGFIGFHLAKKLVSQGHEVTGADNFNDYYSQNLKEFRASILKSECDIFIENLNLANRLEVKNLFDKFRPEYVIHLGAQAGVRLPISDYSKYVESNINGFFNVASCSLENNAAGFLYASSSSVYGDVMSEVLCENNTKLNPSSFYGSTKLCNEIMAKSLFNKTLTHSIGLRFFTVYGEYGRPDMAYFKIITNLLRSTTFNVYGDGSAIRDFTYIDDVTEAISRLVNLCEFSNKPIHEIVNIGGGNPVSLNSMISIIEENFGKQLNKKFGSVIQGDMKKTTACTDKLDGMIGWHPQTKLQDGLSRFIKWATLPNISNKIINEWSGT